MPEKLFGGFSWPFLMFIKLLKAENEISEDTSFNQLFKAHLLGYFIFYENVILGRFRVILKKTTAKKERKEKEEGRNFKAAIGKE